MYNREEEQTLKQPLEVTWNIEEKYWRQGSRIQWPRAVDQNTKFFYQATVEMKRKNSILRIQKSDGSWIENEMDILYECETYFKEVFQTEGCSRVAEQLECVPRIIGDDINESLTRMVDREEVKFAMFQLRGNKALGPNNFPVTFYHRFWDVFGDVVFHSIKGFFEMSILLAGNCYTDIFLIPKVPNPISNTQFRPIILRNFSYIIISKILANRLNLILPILITPIQSAFVSSWFFHDIILITHEVFHHLMINKNGGREGCAVVGRRIRLSLFIKKILICSLEKCRFLASGRSGRAGSSTGPKK